jgi:hypothetical protein
MEIDCTSVQYLYVQGIAGMNIPHRLSTFLPHETHTSTPLCDLRGDRRVCGDDCLHQVISIEISESNAQQHQE